MTATKKRPLKGKKIPIEQLRKMGPSRDVEGQESYVVSEGKPETVKELENAEVFVVMARGHLQKAGAEKTLERVRLAISSLKGAKRNAWNVASRGKSPR